MFHFHFMGRCGREQRTRVKRTYKRNVVEHVMWRARRVAVGSRVEPVTPWEIRERPALESGVETEEADAAEGEPF